jgi:nicotinamide-nucleotide amidase
MDAASVLVALEKRGLKLAFAESLTGGLLCAEFVSVPGASNVVLGAIVAYQTNLKHELLGVSRALLENQGPVDAEVVAQMASGVRTKLAAKSGLDLAQVIGVATTGVAGPDSQNGIEVGTVYIGISGLGSSAAGSQLFSDDAVYAHNFEGSREHIRAATVRAAISHLREHFTA